MEGTVLDVEEDGFVFQGPATNPDRIVLRDADGVDALVYEMDAEGRARLDVGGETLVSDATLLRLEGDPLGEVFTLVLRDTDGEEHAVRIDKAALAAAAPPLGELPVAVPEDALPAVEVLRPLTWPDAPTRSYLLFVEDAARNHLAAANLDGASFLMRAGEQVALVQVPLEDMKWDRVVLQANVAGSPASTNTSFARLRDTDTAAIFLARFALGSLSPAEGETVEMRVLFERRITPLAVERFAEPATYQARVDGQGPTGLGLQTPAQADDCRFAVGWSATDALSGIGGYQVDYRVAGASTWTSWLAPTTERSATFSGEWGRTYEFRATALDKVGNPASTPATGTTLVAAQPSGEDDVNDPPTARILTPRAGEAVAGVVSVTWEATDADGTPLTSRLQVSADDGVTWRTLFAGGGTATSWDTGAEADGATYRLRLTVSDGTQSAQDAVSGLGVRNVLEPVALPEVDPAAPSSSAPTPASPDASRQPAPGDAGAVGEPVDPAEAEPGGKATPMPFVGGALALAALLAARRRRA
jgi:hypothetical protein